MVETVQSSDGTTIAYERVGNGPALIVIGGALNTRHSAAPLAELLAPYFTVYSFDRRGRGDSTDRPPYAVEREVEDLRALADVTAEAPRVYGHSSGAILALEAASGGVPMTKIAVYEPPYTFDPAHPEPVEDHTVQAALDAGDRAGAVEAFLRVVGTDDQGIAWVRQAPFWPGMVAMAHTLPYELALTGDGRVPSDRLAAITAPTLVMDGGASASWAARVASSLAAAMPGARRLTVDGQDHGVAAEVLAPLLIDFFS